MANRNWMSGGKLFSMHKDPVMLDCTIQIGASGAVSSFVGSAIQSVVRQSLGVYKITFQPQTNFPRLLAAMGSMQSAAASLSGISQVEIQNNPNASVSPVSAPSLTVKTLDVSGALANPASGSAVNVLMIMGNSSVVIQGE
jgi:hypothetical protein